MVRQNENLMNKVFDDLSDPLKNTPSIFDGYVISDLSFRVSPYILEAPELNSPNEFRNKFIVHSIDSSEFGAVVGQKNVPRIFAIQQIETHIHKVSHAAGRVVQAFTVFPRERLLVETRKTTTQSSTVAITESVIESASTEAVKEITDEVANETGSTNTQQTSWEVGAKGGFGGIGANAKLSGSETASQTAKQLTKSIRKQANKVAQNRKTEFKLHTEELEEETNVFSKTRTFFNANYDSPMNVSVHESLGHYIVITQVVGQTLVYQSRARDYEVRLAISGERTIAERQVEEFLDQISVGDENDPHVELDVAVKDALTLNVLQDNGGTTPGHYTVEDGFRPRDKITFESNILETKYTFRLQGVPIEIDEIQLPSGDVIGRVLKGLGDGRGDLATSLHKSIEQLMVERQMVAESGRKLINALSEKMANAGTVEEAQEWARLAVYCLEAVSENEELLESFEEPEQ